MSYLRPLILSESPAEGSGNTIADLIINGKLPEAHKALSDATDSPDTDLLKAAALIQSFIQVNFTGPQLDGLIPENTSGYTLKDLSASNEPANVLTKASHLLVEALKLLRDLVEKQEGELQSYAQWWLTRALVIQQSLLFASAGEIHDSLNELFPKFKKLVESDSELATRYYLEKARSELVYDYDSKAEQDLKLGQNASGLLLSLTGFMAKRTQFQTVEHPVLLLLAKSRKEITASGEETQLPEALPLNSDLFLEKPLYSTMEGEKDPDSPFYRKIAEGLQDIDPNSQPALRDIDSALLMLREQYIRQCQATDAPFVKEELSAYVQRLIHAPSCSVNWLLFSRALWERSVLESDSPKTIERGILQMQALVDELGHSAMTYIPRLEEVDKAEDEKLASPASRLRYVHQTMPLPSWSMDALLAEKYLSIGSLKTALGLYERLQMWAEMAMCLAAVDKQEEGIAILQKHLDENPDDARGWSVMGDITLKPEYWEKAWELGKYAPSKRSLGQWFYMPPKGVERDLDLAIRHFNESLHVNPLHLNTWFLYGCCGLETEQYELAAEAFTRCVALDESDPKAWSNLSTSLLRLGKKTEAFNALKKSTRAASENSDWRIWANYVTVAIELEEWNEVLRGTKNIISIMGGKEGEKAIDVPVVEALVSILVTTEYPRAVAGPDGEEVTPRLSFFQKECIDLTCNIIPKLLTSNARVWKAIAKVETWRKHPWAALECFEKGFRVYTNSPTVQEHEKVFADAVEFLGELCEAYENFGEMEGRNGGEVCPDWKYKCKSAVRVLVGRGKNYWEETKAWEDLMTLKENLPK